MCGDVTGAAVPLVSLPLLFMLVLAWCAPVGESFVVQSAYRDAPRFEPADNQNIEVHEYPVNDYITLLKRRMYPRGEQICTCTNTNHHPYRYLNDQSYVEQPPQPWYVEPKTKRPTTTTTTTTTTTPPPTTRKPKPVYGSPKGYSGYRERYPWKRLPKTMCFRNPCKRDKDCCQNWNLCDKSARVCTDCWYGSKCKSERDCCRNYPYCARTWQRSNDDGRLYVKRGKCVDKL